MWKIVFVAGLLLALGCGGSQSTLDETRKALNAEHQRAQMLAESLTRAEQSIASEKSKSAQISTLLAQYQAKIKSINEWYRKLVSKHGATNIASLIEDLQTDLKVCQSRAEVECRDSGGAIATIATAPTPHKFSRPSRPA